MKQRVMTSLVLILSITFIIIGIIEKQNVQVFMKLLRRILSAGCIQEVMVMKMLLRH